MQLPLGLKFPAHQRIEEFVHGDNAAAVGALQRSLAQADAPWVFLAGAEGSGKTHLLIAACQLDPARTAQYLPLAMLGESAEAALMSLDRFDLVCIDDVQAIAGRRGAEIALFDVYNRARAQGATLVFAARHAPARLPLELPDLASRLSSCSQFVLKPLDEEARREVLKARAARRGFELDDPVLDFLFRRYPRDLGAMLELLDRLDRESLAAQRRITVPFLRRIMGLPSRS
ncbi:MAG TPA: DnaA regulatory inactivator Hda [Xanthomonadales bacterium]|nr:DnaA regulatory inactivator Hda [Xanthomonadales bacterium]